MAPEQALSTKLDRRTDVFAIGAVLFHLVVGEAPFEGPNDVAILRALLAGVTPPVPNDVPAPVRDVLARALAPKPGDRHPTALALADAIEVARIAIGASDTEADVARFVRAFSGAPIASAADVAAAATVAMDATLIDPTRFDAPRARSKRVALPLSAGAIALAIGLGVFASRVETPVASAATISAATTTAGPIAADPPPPVEPAPPPRPTVTATAPAKASTRPTARPARPRATPPPAPPPARDDDDLASSLRDRR